MSQQPDTDSGLARPQSIKLLWKVFAAILALTVLGQLFIKVKGYFVVDGWFGFAALFGFGSCVLMVIIAKGLGRFLKRDQDYYRAGDSDD